MMSSDYIRYMAMLTLSSSVLLSMRRLQAPSHLIENLDSDVQQLTQAVQEATVITEARSLITSLRAAALWLKSPAPEVSTPL